MLRKLTLALALFCLCTVSAVAQFAVNGNASQLDENCYELTPALNSQAGSIWFLDKISLEEDFILQFDIYLGDKDDNGADGVYFAMQPISTSLGGIGEGIGFQGIDPAIGVEFDTWQNGGQADPAFDHMAIMSNGVVNHSSANNLDGPVQTSPTAANVEDDMFHQAKITWNADAQILAAYYDCELRVQYLGDMINDIFGGDPEVFWGFTSATGGANNSHQVCFDFISFTELPDTTICAGQSVQLSVPTNFAGYSWSPTTGLDDASSPMPVATPTETTTYMVTIIDECLDEFTDEVTITVDEFASIELGNDTTICSGGSLLLDATPAGGGSPDFVYTWQDGSGEATFEVTESGTYWVTVADGDCAVSDTIMVLLGAPEVDAGEDVSICEGDATQLVAVATSATASDFSFVWSPADGLSATDVADPMANPTVTTTYTITITDEVGCTASDEVTVEVTALSNPGTMSAETVYACDGESVSATTSGEDLVVGDVLGYVLHNSATDELGSILAMNTSGTFNLSDGSLATNTLYYVSAVAGEESVGTGFPDLEHPCTVSNAGTPVVFLDPVLIEADYSCDDITLEFSVVFSIFGGLPQFDASAMYVVTGDFFGEMTAGVEEQIGPFPNLGGYVVHAMDDIGCMASNGVDSIDCKNTPIELLYFTGESLAEGNLLEWATAVEVNNDYFSILRSVDGVTFEEITRIDGAGDNFTLLEYDFLDQTAPNGRSYYQLVQTDYDGQTSRSNVISLWRNTQQAFSISASVLQDQLQIAYTIPNEVATHFSIFDVQGRTLLNNTEYLPIGNGTMEVDIAQFSPGLYILNVVHGQERLQVKFLKTGF